MDCGGHLVIAGPGRAGTTLLVRLLGQLGLDIGDEFERPYFASARAGLENDLLAENAPYVIKNPDLTWLLPDMLDRGLIEPATVRWLVVPIRDLGAAAASRVAVTIRDRDVHAPGGMVRTLRPSHQAIVLAQDCYRLLEAAAAYEIRTVLVAYPRFAVDSEYAYRALSPLVDCSADTFQEAWKEIVDESLVTTPQMPSRADLNVLTLRARRSAKRTLLRLTLH